MVPFLFPIPQDFPPPHPQDPKVYHFPCSPIQILQRQGPGNEVTRERERFLLFLFTMCPRCPFSLLNSSYCYCQSASCLSLENRKDLFSSEKQEVDESVHVGKQITQPPVFAAQ